MAAKVGRVNKKAHSGTCARTIDDDHLDLGLVDEEGLADGVVRELAIDVLGSEGRQRDEAHLAAQQLVVGGRDRPGGETGVKLVIVGQIAGLEEREQRVHPVALEDGHGGQANHILHGKDGGRLEVLHEGGDNLLLVGLGRLAEVRNKRLDKSLAAKQQNISNATPINAEETRTGGSAC